MGATWLQRQTVQALKRGEMNNVASDEVMAQRHVRHVRFYFGFHRAKPLCLEVEILSTTFYQLFLYLN